jgi:hypothetical protein
MDNKTGADFIQAILVITARDWQLPLNANRTAENCPQREFMDNREGKDIRARLVARPSPGENVHR